MIGTAPDPKFHPLNMEPPKCAASLSFETTALQVPRCALGAVGKHRRTKQQNQPLQKKNNNSATLGPPVERIEQGYQLSSVFDPFCTNISQQVRPEARFAPLSLMPRGRRACHLDRPCGEADRNRHPASGTTQNTRKVDAVDGIQ